MDDEPTSGDEDDVDGARPDAASGPDDGDDGPVSGEKAGAGHAEDDPPEVTKAEADAEAEIIELPWDDDMPVALGEETELAADGTGGADGTDGNDDPHGDAGDPDLDELPDYDQVAPHRNALPRRVESWRTRSASGAIATAIAMGLQQVFEPERKRPAAVAEAPGDPYNDDDPVTVDYVPDDAEATRVHVKPWLLQKGDPS